jgi:hypothetical protein
MSTKDRVQKHRAKLMAEQCGRLEVFIGLDVNEAVRALAKRKKISTLEVVEDALKAAPATGRRAVSRKWPPVSLPDMLQAGLSLPVPITKSELWPSGQDGE